MGGKSFLDKLVYDPMYMGRGRYCILFRYHFRPVPPFSSCQAFLGL